MFEIQFHQLSGRNISVGYKYRRFIDLSFDQVFISVMLSRKNKDLRTIKEGVVGKYVKKETPPEMPSKLLLLLLSQIIFEKTKPFCIIVQSLCFSPLIFFQLFNCFQLFVYYRGIMKYNIYIFILLFFFFLQLLLSFSY